MKLLLYCIIRNDPAGQQESHTGLYGTPLQFIAEGDLMAVVSEIDRPEAILTIEAATEYHGVIKRLHGRGTVIPLRLGALFDRKRDVKELLHTRRERFVAMLGSLDGCVEMGLRVVLDGVMPEDSSPEVADRPPSVVKESDNGSPGTAYLLRKKTRYMGELTLQDITRRIVDECTSHFNSLCTQVTYDPAQECTHNGRPCTMVSVNFLVPREKEAKFREAFKTLDSQMRSKALLTGPWPPYNFVVPVDGREILCPKP